MRRILTTDLTATAQLLAGWPAPDRPALLHLLLSQAHAADRYARRFCRPHPVWGDGSLLARVLAEPCHSASETSDYWYSLSLVAAAVAARRRDGCRATLGLSEVRPIC